MMINCLAFAALLAGSMCGTCFGQATVNPETKAPGAGAPAGGAQKKDATAQPAPKGVAKPGWWNDAVFYEVFVRSFQDSTQGPLAGDGIGDFQGLIEKLDYLNDGDPATKTDLGVTALWLMPITASPSYHGYDTTDYRKVNPEYGTNEDFKRFVGECHKRGIKVVIDLVLNHCSSRHAWFEAALDPASDKRGWFIWADAEPSWRGPWGQQVWHRARSGPGAGRSWFYGIFSSQMPDLNYREPAVSEAMLDVVRFWVRPQAGEGAPTADGGMGIDGYRLDAIRHLVEDGRVQENTPGTHEWLRLMRRELRKANPEAMTVGEVWASSEVASSYVGDQLDLAFEFDLANAMIDGAKDGSAAKVHDAQEKVLRLYPPNQYGRFLTNHDQTRVMTRLGGDAGAMRAAAAMLLLGPGVPFVYYGEELGLTGDKPDERLRTPMPWADGPNVGFSTHRPWQRPAAGSERVNVQAESADPGSLLSWYRRLIALRAGSAAVRHGAVGHVDAAEAGVYAFLRSVPAADGAGAGEGGAGAVLVVVNLSRRALEGVKLSMASSPLRGVLAATDALEEPVPGSAPAELAADERSGAFAGFVPVERLGPRAVHAFVLTPAGRR